ncbi:hypothetical protein VNI00_013270 [Paramarasmius palmivorus]|uniref:Uncharacterized protein n=1 Tax=Paramarasmius palmivorus TaxID=297713 RepID=A0AAW0BZK0_9AGAR
MAPRNTRCPAPGCGAELASIASNPRVMLEVGNVYSIRMSIFKPLFAFAGYELSDALSKYPDDPDGKGPRPCVIYSVEDEDKVEICLMATFHKTPFAALQDEFRDRSLPIYSTGWTELAITEDGHTHIHTTPSQAVKFPSYIVPFPVMCRRDQLEDWHLRPVKGARQAIEPKALQACHFYLGNKEAEFDRLNEEIHYHRTLSSKLQRNSTKRNAYIARIQELSDTRPPNPSMSGRSMLSKGTTSGLTHRSLLEGPSRRGGGPPESYKSNVWSQFGAAHQKTPSIARGAPSVADSATSWRKSMSREPPLIDQSESHNGDPVADALSRQTQNMTLVGDAGTAAADRASIRTGTGRKMNIMNRFKTNDSKSMRSGIGSVFNFQPSSSKYGKQAKTKTASISSNRFSLLQPSTPPPVSPVAG